MRSRRKICCGGITQQAVDPTIRIREFAVKYPEEFRQPPQTRRTKYVNFEPKTVFRFVTRAATFEPDPWEPTEFLENRSQSSVGPAENVGIGHGVRISARREELPALGLSASQDR